FPTSSIALAMGSGNNKKEIRAFITAYMTDVYASDTLNYYYGRLLYFEGADVFATVSSTFLE
ncbi:hypothetical protein, partial [Citrobacter youngae]|uniref:hypothetical protein n=1 Tax=Citrobacter youngae TaxID=133448 RepID=UPI001952B772